MSMLTIRDEHVSSVVVSERITNIQHNKWTVPRDVPHKWMEIGKISRFPLQVKLFCTIIESSNHIGGVMVSYSSLMVSMLISNG
jgi:hypothetical protein